MGCTVLVQKIGQHKLEMDVMVDTMKDEEAKRALHVAFGRSSMCVYLL